VLVFIDNLAMIATILSIYFCIGLLITIGPGRKEITRGISVLFTPAWKVALFVVIMTLAMVFFWPFLLSHLWQEKRERNTSIQAYEARVAQGLEFSRRMGGAGEILWREGDFRQEIISFIHGVKDGPDGPDGPIDAGTEGRQCLTCGMFQSVDWPADRIVECKCGGKLSRDHFLFCPKCRSRKLKYVMSYIT